MLTLLWPLWGGPLLLWGEPTPNADTTVSAG
jgi:hypothetical protein